VKTAVIIQAMNSCVIEISFVINGILILLENPIIGSNQHAHRND